MKKVLFFLTIAASLFIIKDLVFSIYTLWSKKDLLTEAQAQLAIQQQENRKLQAQLAQVKKQGYVETQARNKLFLVRSGESIVVVPQAKQPTKPVTKALPKPNWQQWLELFH